MTDPIDIETQQVKMTTPKLVALIAAVAGSLFGAGIGYAHLATEDYVDKRAKTVDEQLMKLATAQTEAIAVVTILAGRADKHDKDIGTLVKLAKISFVEQVDEREARTKRARRRPRSAKSRHVAQLLKLDPDDPMAGLELLEATTP